MINYFTTGSPQLDALLEELRAGDNVVFYTDRPEDYIPFVAAELCAVRDTPQDLVYVRVSGMFDELLATMPEVQVLDLGLAPSGANLVDWLNTRADAIGPRVVYLFETLSTLRPRLRHEAALRDFFLGTCPYLYRLDTVAYWGLTRGEYSATTIAAIKDCTQIFVQVRSETAELGETAEPGAAAEYSGRHDLMITPVKVWGRYSEAMFRPHRVSLAGDPASLTQPLCLQPLAVDVASDNAYIEALAAKNRELATIRDALNASNAELSARNQELARLNAQLAEQNRLHGLLRQNLDHVLALLQAGQEISSSLVVNQVRRAVLTATVQLFDLAASRLLLADGAQTVDLWEGACPAWASALEPELARLRETARAQRRALALAAPQAAGSAAVAPLVVRGQVIGLVEAYATDARLCETEPQTLLGFLAAEAGIALDNAHLYRETEVQGQQLRSYIDKSILNEEQESRRFALDLHDGMVQLIVASFQHLQTAQALRGRDGGAEEREIEHGVRYLRQAIYESRKLISQLRPAGLDDLGLLHALRIYAAQLEAASRWEVTLDVDPAWGELPSALEAAIFRIVQEAGTNAAKYAHSPHLEIRLRVEPETLVISVRDDGRGFDPEAVLAEPERGAHIGLVGIRERARLLGGACIIHSAPEQGTLLTVTIPRQGPLAKTEDADTRD
jgi:signal transduction histidine kinase